jgi:hypothetical protein
MAGIDARGVLAKRHEVRDAFVEGMRRVTSADNV